MFLNPLFLRDNLMNRTGCQRQVDTFFFKHFINKGRQKSFNPMAVKQESHGNLKNYMSKKVEKYSLS